MSDTIKYILRFDFLSDERDEMLAFIDEIRAESGRIVSYMIDDELWDYLINDDGTYTVNVIEERIVFEN